LDNVKFKATQVVDSSFKDGENNVYYTETGIALPTVSDIKKSLNSNDGTFSSIVTYESNYTDSNGKTTFANLPLGIYLIQEIDEPASVITRVADFVVSIPTTSNSGKSWNYDVVVYPKTINGVLLTYDANNGTGNTSTETRYANKTEPLTVNSFKNGSKLFLGWSTNPTSKIPDYYDMQDFTMPDEDTTLYAVWGYTTAIRYYTAFKYSEPWGLKFSFALLNPNTNEVINYSKYDNYGMYIMSMDSEDTETPSMSEVITQGKLYSNETATFNPVSLTFNDGKTTDYLTLTYDKDIYTQNLADDIYVLTYVTYKGRTFWGTVKNRCVEDSVDSVIVSKQIGLTTYTDSEVQLATAIKQMYNAEKEYYISNGSTNTTYPDGMDVKSAGLKQGSKYSFSYITSLRTIAPWGLKLQAAPSLNLDSSITEYGCIVYTDMYRTLEENTPTLDELLELDGTVVYSSKNDTATIETNSRGKYITCYQVGLYTYRLAQTDIYTCFYYVKNGNYYYSEVKKRNCLDMAEIGSLSNEGNLAGNVYSAMINLYNETYYYRNGYYPTRTK
jgi:hypothetical protein